LSGFNVNSGGCGYTLAVVSGNSSPVFFKMKLDCVESAGHHETDGLKSLPASVVY